MKPHRSHMTRWLAPALVLLAVSPLTAELTDFQRDALAKVSAADAHYESGNHAEAAELYQRGYVMTSKSRGLMFRYGMSLLRSGRLDEAINVLDKVTRDNPLESLWDKGRNRSETSSMIAEAHLQLGSIYEKQEAWGLALSSYESASSTSGSDWRAPYAAAYLYFSQREDPSRALEYLSIARTRDPGRREITNLIANCHNSIGVERGNAGDEAGALAGFSEALRWRPGWEVAEKNIAVIKLRQAVANAKAPQAASHERLSEPELPFELVGRFLNLLWTSAPAGEVAAMLNAEPRLALIRDSSEQTTLHLAPSREIAELLLDAGADPSIRDKRGGEALFGAIARETPEVARLLAEQGSDLFTRDDQDRTLLHEAASRLWNSTETLQWLLDRTYAGGGLVDRKDKTGVTPLMLASNENVADLLLAFGADLSVKDESGKTAADHAVEREIPELAAVLQELAQFGPKPRDYVVAAVERGDVQALKTVFAIAPGLVNAVNDDGDPLIAIAAAAGADNLLSFLIQSGARLGYSAEVAVLRAAMAGRLNAVRTLLAAGVDVRSRDVRGYALLDDVLAKNADFDCIVAILDAGADVNAVNGDGNTPLMRAAETGNVGIVRVLLERGANPRPKNPEDSPLLYASADCTRILIEAGADVNARGTVDTPLQNAASKGDIERLKLLVEHGADVKAVDGSGKSALHSAIGECAGFLIEHGAEVNLRDADGKTPLHVAVGQETTDTMKVLVEHGADVNAVDSYGRSPLFELDALNAERSKFLLEHGANPNIRDINGNTPLDLALEMVRTNEEKFPQFPEWAAKPREIAAVLTQAGAKRGAEL